MDTLEFSGFKVSTSEFVDYILDGLPGKYDAFVTSVLTKKYDYTIVEIESFLLVQESRIKKSIGGFVNIATNGNLMYNTQTKETSTLQRAQQRDSNTWNDNRWGALSGARGRGRSSDGKGNRNNQVCQVCGKTGHVAWYYHFKFDKSHHDPFPSSYGRGQQMNSQGHYQ